MATVLLCTAALPAMAPAGGPGTLELLGPGTAKAKRSSQVKLPRQAKRKLARRLKLDNAIGNLQPLAERRWPESFGGAWLGQRGKIFFAFTENAGRRVDRLRKTFPKPGKLRAVSVARSLNELRQFQAKVIAERETDRATLLVPTPPPPPPPRPPFPPPPPPQVVPISYDLDIDIQANLVTAIVENASSDVVAALKARHGSELEVRQGKLVSPDACIARDNCTPDLRSGLAVNTAPGHNGLSAGCSTAFTVRAGSGAPSFPGPYDGILSAAHCGAPGEDVFALSPPDTGGLRFHAGTAYGVVAREQLFNSLDAEVHAFPGFLFPGFGDGPFSMDEPLVYLNDQRKDGRVIGTAKYASLLEGVVVCKSGKVTGETCGIVTSKNYSPDYVHWSSQFVGTKACSADGDSGAGVYQKLPTLAKAPPLNRALGILSGSTSIPCGDPQYVTVFGHIEFVIDAFGLAVNKQKFK